MERTNSKSPCFDAAGPRVVRRGRSQADIRNMHPWMSRKHVGCLSNTRHTGTG